MHYLLDTNAVIALLNDPTGAVSLCGNNWPAKGKFFGL